MNIQTLLDSLNKAIQSDTLALTDNISGVTWTSGIAEAIKAQLGLTALSVTAAGLKAVAAPAQSVTVAAPAQSGNGVAYRDLPSVMLFGAPDSDVLSVPKDRLLLTVYATPVDLNDPASKVDFTVILQIILAETGFTQWSPGDSFPDLAKSSVFDKMIATAPVSFIVTSMQHNQQWTYGGGGGNFTNNFAGLQTGVLNLQVPSGLATAQFPPVKALLGDLNSVTFIFNGTVDTSKSDSNPDGLPAVSLLAPLGEGYNKTFTDNPKITVDFSAGFQAIPAETEPNPPDTETASVLVTQLVLQAVIGKVLIQAIAPLSGNTLSFSMNGLDDKPVLSLSDVAGLFNKDTLGQNLPSSLQNNDQGGNSIFKNIGIQNVGLSLNIPGGGAEPSISSILLEVGYSAAQGSGFGYQSWFELDKFSVIWFVMNPFPVSGSTWNIMFSGNFNLLKGNIDFNGSYNQQDDNGTSKRVFELQGGLKDEPNNVIQLSEIFKQFSSASADIPDIAIDALAFDTKPDQKYYSGNLEVVMNKPFKGFNAPQLKKFAADVTSNNGTITGSIDTEIAIGQVVFDLHADRSPDVWKFSAQSEESFSIGDLAQGFGLDSYPSYLDSFNITQASIQYLAPITQEGDSAASTGEAASTFAIDLGMEFPIAGETYGVDVSYKVDSDKWVFDGKLSAAPENAPDNKITFAFTADGSKAAQNGDSPDTPTPTNIELSAQLVIPQGGSVKISDLAAAFGFKNSPAYLNDIQIEQAQFKYARENGEKSYSIVVEVGFPIAGESFDLTITYSVDKDGWSFVGILVLGPAGGGADKALKFEIDANRKTDNSSTLITASLLPNSKKSMSLTDLAAAFNQTMPPLPDWLNDIGLKDAKFKYETDPTQGKGILVTATSETYGELVFCMVKTGADTNAVWKPFFALRFAFALDFKNLPVVGSFISKFDDNAGIKQIQIAIAGQKFEKKDVGVLSTLFENAGVDSSLIPDITDDTIPREIVFNATLNLGDEQKPVNFAIKLPAQQAAGAKAPARLAAVAADDTPSSVPDNNSGAGVNKTFGPVQIDKFNIGYSGGKIVVDISGAMSLAGIALSFEGMGMRMAFPPKKASDLSFVLHGLGINVNKGSLRIQGGFITMDDNYDNFMGMLAVTAGTFGMQAYGGYATTPKESFFIFANINFPIGGPPFFFVDGIAGGFGYNREFILPDFDDLATFPLLPGAGNPLPSGKPSSINDVTQALTVLAKYIPPKEGAYWIAAGLDVTSFEIIQLEAVLDVSFGAELQIGLLGNASMSIPEPVEPIAFISINFEVNILPEEGLFQAFGMLTPASYIFGGACHLSGGFAFFIWGKGEHEGDFVVSLGGYHPAFRKPDWYPAVPRLAMRWDLGPLKIEGQAYFAMTPHMLMAGLSLSASFEAGPVKATFDAGFDFLLGWKPFFYLADAYIHINIELHILFTIHIHVGVDLNLWGPPFGGKAVVDLDIISFTIHFGSSGPQVQPIQWVDFKKMLPNSYPQSDNQPLARNAPAMYDDVDTAFSVSQVLLSKGLIQQFDGNPLNQSTNPIQNEKVFNWLIDPNDFELRISAGVPCNNFVFNGKVARNQQNKPNLVPDDAGKGYVLPSDIASFFTNKNNANPNVETIYAYDYSSLCSTQYWWNQKVKVGPTDFKSGEFDALGNRTSGFASTVHVTVSQLTAQGNQIQQENENNFVVVVVTGNSATALWGDLVNPGNGGQQLNTPVTVPGTLIGLILRPKIWNPERTLPIELYLLLYEAENKLYWTPDAAPSVPANNFQQNVTDNGDTMTFNLKAGTPVTNKFRQLDPAAFQNITQGQALINQLNTVFGFSLTVDTDQVKMAEPMYKDWPVLALLGEEDDDSVNIIP